MATINKHEGKWQAQVCVAGVRRSKTFLKKDDARRWAERTQADLQAGRASRPTLTLAELCSEYERAVVPSKNNQRYDCLKLRWWAATPLGGRRVVDITPKDLQSFVDSRLDEVQPSSARREFVLLQAVMTWAVKKGWLPESPCKGVEKPQDNPPRDRVVTDEELGLLMQSSGWSEGEVPRTSTQRVMAAFLLSCLTGMRGGEIIRLTDEMMDLDAGVIYLPAAITKTRRKRAVACGARAIEILRCVQAAGLKPEIFGLTDARRDALFRKIRDRAGIVATPTAALLHFHDARATFCTWAASPGEDGAPRLDVLSLAKQLGHQNIKQLMTYYRPKAEDLAKRLN